MRNINQGDEIIVDTQSILAMTEGLSFDIRQAGGCAAMCCGGEGAFNTVVSGQGKVRK
jgi:uncharacterized protein (AIM24 family)